MEPRAILNKIACRSLGLLVDMLDTYATEIKHWSFEPVVANSGDTIKLKFNQEVTLHRVFSDVTISNMSAAMNSDEFLCKYLSPSTLALAFAIQREAREKSVHCSNCGSGMDLSLLTRRSTLPLPGCGAFATYAELGDFGIRALIYYEPKTLSQIVTLDVLFALAQVPRAGAN